MKRFFTLLLSIGIVCAISTQAAGQSEPQSYTELHNTEGAVITPAIKSPPSQVTPSGSRAVTYYADRATFDADFPGLPVEGWENANVGPGAVVSFDGPLDEYTNNAYFSPGDVLPGIGLFASTTDIAVLGAGYLGYPSIIALANTFADYNTLMFDPPVKAVGMDVVDLLGSSSCDIYAYDQGLNLLASVNITIGQTATFWGIHSDTPIGSIELHSTGGEGADNIAFGAGAPVPVSNWALLLGIAAILIFAVYRLRKAF